MGRQRVFVDNIQSETLTKIQDVVSWSEGPPRTWTAILTWSPGNSSNSSVPSGEPTTYMRQRKLAQFRKIILSLADPPQAPGHLHPPWDSKAEIQMPVILMQITQPSFKSVSIKSVSIRTAPPAGQ